MDLFLPRIHCHKRLSSSKKKQNVDLLAHLRSVIALKKDLVTLEEHYNICSHHLAHGETVDFSKEPLGKNLWEVYMFFFGAKC